MILACERSREDVAADPTPAANDEVRFQLDRSTTCPRPRRMLAAAPAPAPLTTHIRRSSSQSAPLAVGGTCCTEEHDRLTQRCSWLCLARRVFSRLVKHKDRPLNVRPGNGQNAIDPVPHACYAPQHKHSSVLSTSKPMRGCSAQVKARPTVKETKRTAIRN